MSFMLDELGITEVAGSEVKMTVGPEGLVFIGK